MKEKGNGRKGEVAYNITEKMHRSPRPVLYITIENLFIDTVYVYNTYVSTTRGNLILLEKISV